MRQVKAIVGAGLLLGMGASWGASTVVVGTAGCSAAIAHPLYSTIQNAIDSVPANTIVEVCPGTYPEQVTINKNLTLKGVVDKNSNSSAVTIAVPAAGLLTIPDVGGGQPIAAQIAVVNGASVAISALTVDGTGNNIQTCAEDLVGVLFQNAQGSLKLSSIVNQINPPDYIGCQGGLAVFAQTDNAHTETVVISTNSIENFDKNGITADGGGLTVTISDNSITGIGATDLIAQNGIQVSDGASGTVSNNRVSDSVYSPNTYGASGILVYDSPNVKITGNTVTNTQYAVAVVSDGSISSDFAVVTNNTLSQTVFWDAIDLCRANHATVTGNDIRGTGEAAIHVEGSTYCGAASIYAAISNNTINGACAGVLSGPGSDFAISGKPKYYNVVNDTLAAPDDLCPTGAQNAAKRGGKVSAHPKLSPALSRAAHS